MEKFVEIITIGDEILYGQITDTNSQWISQQLTALGFSVIRKSSVGDSQTEILKILEESYLRSDLIIITGGLGPTKDDITKQTLCRFFNSRLQLHKQALQDVKAFFAKRGKELSETNLQQAYLPDNCEYIRNESGTAPGMLFEKEGKIFVSLPGVPFEMKNIISQELIPILKSKFILPVIEHFFIRTSGIGESYLSDIIKDWEENLPSHIKLAYLPSLDGVKLRLTGKGRDLEELRKQLNEQVSKVKPLIEKYIYGYQDDELISVISNKLKSHRLTISTAESCTGGLIASEITSIAGSSEYFKGSVVAYDNQVKINTLGVNSQSLSEDGAVSESTVRQMAENIRIILKTDIGVATSGIAGPGGGTKDKPVGTVWIAYSDEEKTVTRKLNLSGTRENIIRLTSVAVKNLILECLKIKNQP
ncbi:MAG: competence/damage-inducible protein A [Cytophagaceae bacterium]